MNRLALDYLDAALALEEENRELRRLLTGLLFLVAQDRDLLAIANARLAEQEAS